MYHKRQKNIGWTPTQGQPPNHCLAAGLFGVDTTTMHWRMHYRPVNVTEYYVLKLFVLSQPV